MERRLPQLELVGVRRRRAAHPAGAHAADRPSMNPALNAPRPAASGPRCRPRCRRPRCASAAAGPAPGPGRSEPRRGAGFNADIRARARKRNGIGALAMRRMLRRSEQQPRATGRARSAAFPGRPRGQRLAPRGGGSSMGGAIGLRAATEQDSVWTWRTKSEPANQIWRPPGQASSGFSRQSKIRAQVSGAVR